MHYIYKQDPEIALLEKAENERQVFEIELIASENYVSKAVLEANGSIFTNKYSEGYPGKRYYAWQEFIDKVETIAINRAKQLFNAEHVNVQPYSGSPANIAVFFALLEEGDTVLGMNLDHGGHLTHGHPLNYSGKKFNIVSYWVHPQTERIDMEEVRKVAKESNPKLIIAGFSAYSHSIDWQSFREIADEVGAILMADISHIAWLIAGKQLENPVPICDIVTTTTHKTLRGPRGAMILCKNQYAKKIDAAVFPGLQWWPHEHTIFAKAVAFKEALDPKFSTYARQVIDNMKTMSKIFVENNVRVIGGISENHLALIDVCASFNITGKEAEKALEDIGISTNKNMIPFDTRKPLDPSWIRIGTAAITTRGFGEKECSELAEIMLTCLRNINDQTLKISLKNRVRQLCRDFPIPESFI